MSHSNAYEQRPPSSALTTNQLVRDYLEAAAKRLDELDPLVEGEEPLVWAVRDIRWAVHHLLEIVEGGERRTMREHGDATVNRNLPALAFARFVDDRWRGLSGEARTLAFDAFVEGGCAALGSLVEILELEPVSDAHREFAGEIRLMIEARRGS